MADPPPTLSGECEGLGFVQFVHHTGVTFRIGDTLYLVVSYVGDGSFGKKTGLGPTIICAAPSLADPQVEAQVVAVP